MLNELGQWGNKMSKKLLTVRIKLRRIEGSR